MGKRKFISSLLFILVRKTFILANVLYVYLTRRSTRTLGKLRAIFRSIKGQGEWDATLGLVNPAAFLPVKEYLKSVAAEQLQARITPRQATPLFLNKLLILYRLGKDDVFPFCHPYKFVHLCSGPSIFQKFGLFSR